MAKAKGGEGAAAKDAGKKKGKTLVVEAAPAAPVAPPAKTPRAGRGRPAADVADPLAETKRLANRAPSPAEGVPVSPRRGAAKDATTSAAEPATRRTTAKSAGSAATRGASAGTRGRTAKSASAKSAKTSGRRKPAPSGPDLREDLRSFASARPQGWDHDDWLSFVDHLRGRGHDTSDPDSIGMSLERERLAVVLSDVPGLGPRRVDALVNRFETLWSLRQAHVDDIAKVPGIPRALAERVAVSLHDRF